MTLTTTVIGRTVFGDRKVVIGYTTNDSTGGDIVTGLNRVDIFLCVGLGSAAVEIGVNETFPLAKGDVTVVTESGKAFSWMAIGK